MSSQRGLGRGTPSGKGSLGVTWFGSLTPGDSDMTNLDRDPGPGFLEKFSLGGGGLFGLGDTTCDTPDSKLPSPQRLRMVHGSGNVTAVNVDSLQKLAEQGVDIDVWNNGGVKTQFGLIPVRPEDYGIFLLTDVFGNVFGIPTFCRAVVSAYNEAVDEAKLAGRNMDKLPNITVDGNVVIGGKDSPADSVPVTELEASLDGTAIGGDKGCQAAPMGTYYIPVTYAEFRESIRTKGVNSPHYQGLTIFEKPGTPLELYGLKNVGRDGFHPINPGPEPFYRNPSKPSKPSKPRKRSPSSRDSCSTPPSNAYDHVYNEITKEMGYEGFWLDGEYTA